jgi:hypothetical protein
MTSWIADQVRNDSVWTQPAQMQACPRVSAGNCSNSSFVKVAPVHQHGGCFTPVADSTSIAHRLDWPHKGQRVVLDVKSAGMGQKHRALV